MTYRNLGAECAGAARARHRAEGPTKGVLPKVREGVKGSELPVPEVLHLRPNDPGDGIFVSDRKEVIPDDYY